MPIIYEKLQPNVSMKTQCERKKSDWIRMTSLNNKLSIKLYQIHQRARKRIKNKYLYL